MITSKISTALLNVSAVVLTLALFSGCGNQVSIGGDKAKKEESTKTTASADKKTEGIALLHIDGKAVLDEGMFNKNINQMLQSSPYFRGSGADSLPLSVKRRFFDELVKQEIIVFHADKNNIEKEAEFTKAYAEMKEMLKRSLKIQLFEKDLFENIKVSDSDIAKHYQDSKEHYVKVAGGVLVTGVKFEKEDQAQTFLASVKAKDADFDKLAKESKNGKYKEFGRVSKEAKGFGADAVPAPVKEAVLAANDLPFVSMIKAGKDFWVVKASDKKETVYFDLEEIKPQLEGMLKQNKFKEILDEKIKDIKGSFKIEVNEEYFKEKAPATPAQAEKDAEDEEDKAPKAAAA